MKSRSRLMPAFLAVALAAVAALATATPLPAQAGRAGAIHLMYHGQRVVQPGIAAAFELPLAQRGVHELAGETRLSAAWSAPFGVHASLGVRGAYRLVGRRGVYWTPIALGVAYSHFIPTGPIYQLDGEGDDVWKATPTAQRTGGVPFATVLTESAVGYRLRASARRPLGFFVRLGIAWDLPFYGVLRMVPTVAMGGTWELGKGVDE